MIALAYSSISVRADRAHGTVKAILLAVAFFSGQPNLFANYRQATLFNDMPLTFCFDVFLVMIGWPKTSPDESFAETFAGSRRRNYRLD